MKGVSLRPSACPKYIIRECPKDRDPWPNSGSELRQAAKLKGKAVKSVTPWQGDYLLTWGITGNISILEAL